MPPVYDFQCQTCEYEDELNISSKEVNTLQHCISCDNISFKRVWKKMPGVTRASYIDSKDTKRGRDMDVHRKIAQLEIKEGNTPHKDRAEIRKEINKLKKV
jgi:hypothetical protein